MVRYLNAKIRVVRLLSVMVFLGTWLASSVVWGVNQPPLSRIPVPEPANLSQYVKDKQAAIQLGKALFWDMQVGSDGTQACASCHYGAGADPLSRFRVTRTTNRVNPGRDAIFGNNSTVVKTFATNPLTGLTSPRDLRAVANPRLQPNYPLQPFDFPLFNSLPVTARLLIDPLTGLTADEVTFLFDTNGAIGSQGVRLADFLAVNNTPLDSGTSLADQIFHQGPAPNIDPTANVRQVTARKTPSVINAVFNFANFWDGRANNIFNGETPYGPLDQNAGVWIDDGFALVKQRVAIPNSSLASQAVAPPVDDVMMSFRGRTFPELGRKMLSLSTPPLGLQLVHPNDSVLGGLSRATLEIDGTLSGNRGLSTDYTQMVRAAFQDYLWNSSAQTVLPTKGAPGGELFSQMEANFALFWGLAIQSYEATLVSDQTPFDHYQAGNTNALSPDLVNAPGIPSAVRGFALFDSKCALCHSGSELTGAAVGTGQPFCAAPDCNRPIFANNTTHRLIQLDLNPNTFVTSLVDAGFHNIGVRATADDPGRGGVSPDGYPLSFAALALLQHNNQLPFVTPGLGAFLPSTPVKVNGAFKVPGLRNVELTAPYFHNGGAESLEQVVEFYVRGGNFPNNPELSASMQPIRSLRNQPDKHADLVAFLKALTDDRVRNETAPFDHPELIIPDGVDAVGNDILLTLSATGGAPPVVPPALTLTAPLLPVAPTTLKTLLVSGTVDPSAMVAVSVNALAPLNATVAGSTWSLNLAGLPVGTNSITVSATTPTGGSESLSFALTVLPVATVTGVPPGGRTPLTGATLSVGGAGVTGYQYMMDNGPLSADLPVGQPISLSGLPDGLHTVSVFGIDGTGNRQPVASPTIVSWTVKATPPLLTVNPLVTPMRGSSLTIGGTVELGSVPSVTLSSAGTVGLVRTVGGNGVSSWSCDLTGLPPGTSTITVRAQDFVFNLTTRTADLEIVLSDGNFKGTGITDISDALKALRIAVGLELPTPLDILHGDVYPYTVGAPADNIITVADALLILKKVVGLVSF